MDDATGDRVGKVFEIGEVFARDNLRIPSRIRLMSIRPIYVIILVNDLRPDFATCDLAKYALAHPLAFRPSLRWMIASTGGVGFQRGAAHCSIIFCSAANPSVSAAGPGCKLKDDLIS